MPKTERTRMLQDADHSALHSEAAREMLRPYTDRMTHRLTERAGVSSRAHIRILLDKLPTMSHRADGEEAFNHAIESVRRRILSAATPGQRSVRLNMGTGKEEASPMTLAHTMQILEHYKEHGTMPHWWHRYGGPGNQSSPENTEVEDGPPSDEDQYYDAPSTPETKRVANERLANNPNKHEQLGKALNNPEVGPGSPTPTAEALSAPTAETLAAPTPTAPEVAPRTDPEVAPRTDPEVALRTAPEVAPTATPTETGQPEPLAPPATDLHGSRFQPTPVPPLAPAPLGVREPLSAPTPESADMAHQALQATLMAGRESESAPRAPDRAQTYAAVAKAPRKWVIATIAGGGSFSSHFVDGVPARRTYLGEPWGLAVDRASNLYIALGYWQRVRGVNAATGIITTVAGNGSKGHTGDGGQGTRACLHGPGGLALDARGNLYIADRYNHRIRRVNADTLVITTVAGDGWESDDPDGGLATETSLHAPRGITLDAAGNLLIAEANRVRRVDHESGRIATIAGTGDRGYAGDGGLASHAKLCSPEGIALDSFGNLYIAESENHCVRRVDAITGVISTVVGGCSRISGGDGGLATSASLSEPTGVALDAVGNLYIADARAGRVRCVDAATGIIFTVAGGGSMVAGDRSTDGGSDGGPATGARLKQPYDLTVDDCGNLYVADKENERVHRVSPRP